MTYLCQKCKMLLGKYAKNNHIVFPEGTRWLMDRGYLCVDIWQHELFQRVAQNWGLRGDLMDRGDLCLDDWQNELLQRVAQNWGP